MKFPVLAIPSGAKFTGMKKILFACDVLQGVPVKVLEQVRNLSADLHSQIEVFFVDEKIEELRNSDSAALAIDIFNDGLEGVTYSPKNVRSNAVIKEIGKEIIDFPAESPRNLISGSSPKRSCLVVERTLSAAINKSKTEGSCFAIFMQL